MRVMVLVKATADSEAGVKPSPETRAMFEAMGAYNAELVKAGILVTADGLQPSSEGKRIRFDGDRRSVVDGPFPVTGELVAGFWIWQVRDMDQAVAWARRCPNPMPGPSEIEIRRIAELDDFKDVLTPDQFAQEDALRAGGDDTAADRGGQA